MVESLARMEGEILDYYQGDELRLRDFSPQGAMGTL